MTRRRVVSVAVVSLAALALVGAAAAGSPRLSVVVDRTAISTSIGKKFSLRATIANRSPAPAKDLIVHLNVLSLDGAVYVDPEDWSSSRTRYLAPIPAGHSAAVSWKLQAVNSGSIGVYVAVLTRGGAPEPPITGPTVHVSIMRRQTLNSGGILPLALGIPGVLAFLAGGVRFQRRRQMTA
jgi:hypothetical protein